MPTPPSSPSSQTLTLSGSADLVTEFFAYAVNSLLYQRGIYAPDTFTRVSKYGLTMLVSTDPGVAAYLRSVLDQMTLWLSSADLDRVVVVITSVATGKPLERWAFNVQSTPLAAPGSENAPPGEEKVKTTKEIVKDIQNLVRQITASVTFMPLLDEPASFDMLIYTKKDTETPAEWEETGPRIISKKQEVKLRSFSTSLHNVDASVSYACDDDE